MAYLRLVLGRSMFGLVIFHAGSGIHDACVRGAFFFLSFEAVHLPFLAISATGTTVHTADGDRILGSILIAHRSPPP